MRETEMALPWVVFALAIAFVRCEESVSKARQLWDIKTDSLSDSFRDNRLHKVFVGKTRWQFVGKYRFVLIETSN